jgi:flagellar assembly protein FliH
MAMSATVLQLFTQDFDAPRAEHTPEPEVIEPTFSAEDVAAAREQGWAEGRESALAEAVTQHELALAKAATAVAEQVAGLQREWQSASEENAWATARLVFDVLGALFPALNAAHGEQEVLALVRALLPGLARQPAVTVRAHPSFAGTLVREFEQHELVDPGRVQVVPLETIASGDVRLLWAEGSSGREAAEVWRRVSTVLRDCGLTIPPIEAGGLENVA